MTEAADRFRELLSRGMRAVGGLKDTREGREMLAVIAEHAMWDVNSETIDHIKVLVGPHTAPGMANVMFDARTLYGCDLLDMIFPEQAEITDSIRDRLIAELECIGQGRTIH